ncbi:MAG TPA: HD domain-containing phosphohydrolase [Solirubrobacterales bacterium]|nr:HD domain-containing phosphohydrolase [Solirubrobacterales bacterium]
MSDELGAARQRIGELEERLTRLSRRDPLIPSLLSLSAFRTQLELDVARAHRNQRPLTVALLDVDRFRHLNLEHGYAAGDAVLAAVAGLIAEQAGAHNLACRMGGDEFAFLLPETGAVAPEAIERLLVELEDLEAGGIRGISASVGIAALEMGDKPESVLAAARAALEQARARGGRQAVVFGGSSENGDAALDSGHGDVIAALASALEERDRYTGEHSESVVDLTARVGEGLALGGEEISRIRTAALLHDIGKVGVPDEILHKPGPLNDQEWEIMRQHPVIGERILRAIPGMGDVARIVRHEHERWDGKGYPDCLRGAEIPVGSRIILACDAYHAMVSDRPYRKAMAHTDAIAELSGNAGAQFDPEVVEALVGYLFGRRQAGLTAV